MHGRKQQGKQLVKKFKQEIPVPNSQAPPDVVKACKFIIKKLDDSNTTVAGIKEQFGIRRKNFTFDFAKFTDLTPRDFITYNRVELSKRLLREKKELKVREVADLCGYPSSSTFSTTFKNITGVTPSQWRNGAE